jgi:hypothetical protein
MQPGRERISAFVISYNRAELLGTCLRALRFADELIVIDKSSSDQAPAVAAGLADRVITVPWSPTVEETRAFALSQCAHDWILFLDDDECLSPEAAQFIQTELQAPRADIYALPLRHYILGEHNERAYYWPEHHVRCFRRGTLQFTATVHAGIVLHSERVMRVPPDEGICIHHLSHPDVTSWIERTNRYTSRQDRSRVEDADPDLIRFAHARIDHWVDRTRDTSADGYPAAVAVLRSVYDLVDRLKSWEEARGQDGAARFREICRQLDFGEPVAICADHLMPSLPTSLYLERRRREHTVLAVALAERDQQLAETTAKLGERSAELAERAAELTARTAEMSARTAELTMLRADSEAKAASAHAEITILTAELALARGSMRIFLRSYLPRLRRHLLGE